MTNKLIATFLFLSCLDGFCSDNLIIATDIKLREGIYRDLHEFKYNNPSLKLDYEIKTKELYKNINYYYLEVDDKISKQIGYVFGFCDGRDVYICNDNSELNSFSAGTLASSGFYKLENLGRYSYFRGYSTNPYYSELNEFVIDFNNGKIIPLNKKVVEEIIQTDEKLYEEFDRSINKTHHFKELLLDYSEKHSDEILIFDFSPKLKELIYFNDNRDSTFDAYFNRVLSYEIDPEIIEIELVKSSYTKNRIKWIGLKCRHYNSPNPDHFYKIGTWVYFDKNGDVKNVVEFDFRERKVAVREDLIQVKK